MASKPSFSLGISGLLDELEARLTPPGSPAKASGGYGGKKEAAARQQQAHSQRQRPAPLAGTMTTEAAKPAPWESFQRRQIAEFMKDVDDCLEYMGELEAESKRRVDALLREPDYRMFRGQSYLEGVSEQESELEDPNASQLIVEGFALLTAREGEASQPASTPSSSASSSAAQPRHVSVNWSRGSPRYVPNIVGHVGAASEYDFGSTCDDSMSGLLDTSAYC